MVERHPLSALVPWPRPHGIEAYGASDVQRGRNFPKEYRSTLVEVLRRQGQSKSAAVDKLAQSEALTVTTGQQLGLGLGPLYTVLKIADTVALARALEDRLKAPVVPVFWLASEDHDAQEINHLWYGGQRFSHTVQPAQNAVGPLPASLRFPKRPRAGTNKKFAIAGCTSTARPIRWLRPFAPWFFRISTPGNWWCWIRTIPF